MDSEAHRLTVEIECLKVAARHFGHRVNNLITEVNGQIALLRTDCESGTELARRLDIMHSSVARLAKETESLHRTARAQEETPTPFALSYVRDLVASYVVAHTRRSGTLEIAQSPAWESYVKGRAGLFVTVVFGLCRAAIARVDPDSEALRLVAVSTGATVVMDLRVPLLLEEVEDDPEIAAVRAIAADEDMILETFATRPGVTTFRITISAI